MGHFYDLLFISYNEITANNSRYYEAKLLSFHAEGKPNPQLILSTAGLQQTSAGFKRVSDSAIHTVRWLHMTIY